MKLPEGRIGTSFDGLSDPSAEMAYFDGREDDRASRSLLSSGESLNIVAFEEEDELTVDEDTASWIIWHEYDGLRQRVSDGEFTPWRRHSTCLDTAPSEFPGERCGVPPPRSTRAGLFTSWH
jgi:hypothetical protein